MSARAYYDVEDKRLPPFAWVDQRITHRYSKKLKAEGLGVYLTLASYRDNVTNECWPSIKTLSDQLDMSENTLKKYLRILEEEGLIRRRPATLRRGTKVWHGYVFTLLDVPDASYDTPSKIDGHQKLMGIKNTPPEGDQFLTGELDPEGELDPDPDLLGGARETKDDHAREGTGFDGNAPAQRQPDVSADAGVRAHVSTPTPGPEGPATAPGVPDPLAAAFAPASAALHEVACAVLAYLNQVTGRQYGSVSLEPALWGIKARLLDGATHEDCYLVIDFCKAVLDVEQPGFADRRLNTQTPWKPDLFDTYINRASAWHAKGRPPATPPDAGRPRRTRRRDLVITNGLARNGVLSNDRTRANVEAAQRGLARLQEELNHDA